MQLHNTLDPDVTHHTKNKRIDMYYSDLYNMYSPAKEEGPVSTQALIKIMTQKKQIQYKLVEEKSTQQVGLFVVPCSLCPDKIQSILHFML